MKITTRRDALFGQLQTVTRAASTRSAVQALSGVQLVAADGRDRAARHRHGDRPARAARGRASSARARSCSRRAWSSTSCGRCPATRSRSSCVPPSRTSRSSAAPRRSTSARCDRRTSRRSPSRRASASRSRAPAFVETVLKVARSASRDETRPVLTGILVSASGQELRMVATDSYRLSVKETQLEAALVGAFEANVPARALQELTRIVQHEERRRAQRLACARTRSSSRWAARSSPRG